MVVWDAARDTDFDVVARNVPLLGDVTRKVNLQKVHHTNWWCLETRRHWLLGMRTILFRRTYERSSVRIRCQTVKMQLDPSP
jgi:hypothetical protein